MDKNHNVDIIYRLICFVVFSVVLLSLKNLTSFLVLLFFLFINSFSEKNNTFPLLYLLCIIMFIISFYLDKFIFIRIILIISYLYYFINVTKLNIIFKTKGQIEKKENENDYVRFKNSKEEDINTIEINLNTTIYVTIHFLFLFISILVGVL